MAKDDTEQYQKGGGGSTKFDFLKCGIFVLKSGSNGFHFDVVQVRRLVGVTCVCVYECLGIHYLKPLVGVFQS